MTVRAEGLSNTEYTLALRLESLQRHPDYAALEQFIQAHMQRAYDAMEARPAQLAYYAGMGDALRRITADITALIDKKNRALAEELPDQEPPQERVDFGVRPAPQAIS